jgi:hypothetical protein
MHRLVQETHGHHRMTTTTVIGRMMVVVAAMDMLSLLGTARIDLSVCELHITHTNTTTVLLPILLQLYCAHYCSCYHNCYSCIAVVLLLFLLW